MTTGSMTHVQSGSPLNIALNPYSNAIASSRPSNPPHSVFMGICIELVQDNVWDTMHDFCGLGLFGAIYSW
jgi:hypothetical protein